MDIESAKAFVEKVHALNNQVKIVAATKTRTPEEINLLPLCGIYAMGENRVQELLSKIDGITVPERHFIGALQTNKVKYIVDKVSMIQSVDRLELAREIDKRSAAIGKVMDILVEVNYGREEAKSGSMPEDTLDFVKEIMTFKNLRVKGLMSVLPIDAPESMYIGMKELFDDVKQICPDAEYLSMGMSDDYEVAIKCGANMIRPGTILFGQRDYSKH